MRHIILTFLLLISVSAFADDYKILYISTETIEIAEQEEGISILKKDGAKQ